MSTADLLIEALDWPPLGGSDLPVEAQIEQIRLIRFNALKYADLQDLVALLTAERDELIQRLENLKLAFADISRIVQSIPLEQQAPIRFLDHRNF